jgi:hypothetical protein
MLLVKEEMTVRSLIMLANMNLQLPSDLLTYHHAGLTVAVIFAAPILRIAVNMIYLD